MKLSKSTLLIAAAILFCVAVVTPAQSPEAAKSSSVQLGDKVIVIPNPEGFEETISQFESVKRFFVSMANPGSDMLLAHLPTSDCELLRTGSRPTLKFYTMVSVFKARRESTQTNADMAGFVAEFRKNGAAILDPDSPVVKSVMEKGERELSASRSEQIKLEAVQTDYLGEFDVRPEVYSRMILFTYRTDVEGTQSVRPTLASMTLLKVGPRIIRVFVYRKISPTA
ncbi:MAG TPA: hypothetical protein VGN86_12095 [Pyrinomonadaceae bacterium]|jgi:hypothetical protein|nr:hypothetical protein [Pyrinomonadaceae bacterium]